jgi:hypothetical protein
LGNALPRFGVADVFFEAGNVEWLVVEMCRRVAGLFEQRYGAKMGEYVRGLCRAEGQSRDSVLAQMQEVYDSERRHLEVGWSIEQQRRWLNEATLRALVPSTYENVGHYITYRRDSSMQPMPLSMPVADTVTGGASHRGAGGVLRPMTDHMFM